MIPFVDLSYQTKRLGDKLKLASCDVIDSSLYVSGMRVQRFEDEFTHHTGACYAIGVSSGYTSLEIALRALRIGAEDEVIVPAFTFVGVIGAVLSVGASPILSDVSAKTSNIDLEKMPLSRKTRAVIAVHTYGRPMEIPPGMPVDIIEDCSHAFGSRIRGESVGLRGAVGCFSLYVTKNLGACGEAGIMITNDHYLAEVARSMRNFGRHPAYTGGDHAYFPMNGKMDEIQAAFLSEKLKVAEEFLNKRRRISEIYNEILGRTEDPSVLHSYHQYVIHDERRDELRGFLLERGIQTGVYWPLSIPQISAFDYLGFKPEDYPNSLQLSRTNLAMPIYPGLSEDQVEFIAESVKCFWGKK